MQLTLKKISDILLSLSALALKGFYSAESTLQKTCSNLIGTTLCLVTANLLWRLSYEF